MTPLQREVTVSGALAMLNEMLRLDSEATEVLVRSRVPCNAELAGHPSIQVDVVSNEARVGLLGVINGLFGADARGMGPIAAVYDSDGRLRCFQPLTGPLD